MLKFYYIDDIAKQQCGPFSPQELLSKNIRQETMVWRSGMSDWSRADSVQELAFLFDPKIPMPQKKEVSVPRETTPIEQKTFSGENTIVNTKIGSSQVNKSDEIREMPKNWMTESVLLSVFCCSPVSVVGIFYASKVQSLYLDGKYEASSRSSDLARNWALLGMLFVPICYIFFFLFTIITGGLAY